MPIPSTMPVYGAGFFPLSAVGNLLSLFLVAPKRLYKNVCPSVCPSPFCNAFTFRATRSDLCRVYGLVTFDSRYLKSVLLSLLLLVLFFIASDLASAFSPLPPFIPSCFHAIKEKRTMNLFPLLRIDSKRKMR